MSEAPANPSKRKRARRACEPCRKRKKKCDGKEPCQLCQEYEYNCKYASEKIVPTSQAPRPNGTVSLTDALPTSAGGHALPSNFREDAAVFDSQKGFLVDASSVLAFPRLLANSLESGQPPKLRNLVYNLGIRKERYFIQGATLSEIITMADAQRYALVFFRIVHPWHAYLEQDDFMPRLARHYQEMLHDPAFEMLSAFVIALGSYFNWPDRFANEEHLVEQAASWMDRSVFPDVTSQVCVYYVAATVTRALYQRATASPREAWLSSCMSMHVVESMGLHKEWDTIMPVTQQASSDVPTEAQLDVRRRIYWTAFTVNRLISTEYGRSSVEIAGTNCKPVNWKPHERFRLLVDIARSLPQPVNNSNNELRAQDYIDALDRLAHSQGEFDPVYIILVRGDAACLLYRRLSLMSVRITDETAKKILSLGHKGTEAACSLAIERQPWWKVISTPFQFLCVLLSIDTLESLKIVPQVLRALLQISEIFNTQRAKEAYDTAQALVQIAAQKKEKGLDCLKEGIAVTTTNSNLAMSQAWADIDINWMELMDPDLFGIDAFV